MTMKDAGGMHGLLDVLHGGVEGGLGVAQGIAKGGHGIWDMFRHGAAGFAKGGKFAAGGGAAGFMRGAGGALGALGVGMGLYEMGHGISDMFHAKSITDSKGSQGLLSTIAGGLGTAAGVGGMAAAGLFGGGSTAGMLAASLGCPPVAIAAGLAGLGAYGNEFAEKHGWYGTDAKGKGKTFTGSIADRYSSVRDAVDIPVLGQIAGGAAAAGQTIWNAGASVVGGVGRLGSAIADW